MSREKRPTQQASREKRPTPNAQRRTRSAEPPNRRTAEPPNRPARTKVKSLAAAVRAARAARRTGRRVVFTNGCFDLVHRGHVRYLERARSLGDLLVVAINSDRSVRRLKGPSRPVVPEAERAEVLAALQVVDVVLVFDDPTPARVIEAIQPDVLVKGGDWPVSRIVGAEFVQSRGGTVLSLPYFAGGSTTALIHRIAAGRVRK